MSRTVFTGDTSFFPGIEQIRYEGPESDNALAFKTYDKSRVVAGIFRVRSQRSFVSFARP